MKDTGDIEEMRKILVAANKLDSFRTLVLMMPALILLLSAAIGLYQGRVAPEEFNGYARNAAVEAASNFTGNYVPYVETTGSFITAASQKLIGAVASCVSGSGRNAPIHFRPGTYGTGLCSSTIGLPSFGGIKPYRFQ